MLGRWCLILVVSFSANGSECLFEKENDGADVAPVDVMRVLTFALFVDVRLLYGNAVDGERLFVFFFGLDHPRKDRHADAVEIKGLGRSDFCLFWHKVGG